jgi:hypothetical protein
MRARTLVNALNITPRVFVNDAAGPSVWPWNELCFLLMRISIDSPPAA